MPSPSRRAFGASWRRRLAESRTAALRRAAARLSDAGLGGAGIDARLLLCAAGGFERVALVAEPEAPFPPEAGERLDALVDRRLAREPVSRILGRRAFWSLDAEITPAVLDPRPETETLVEAGLGFLALRREEPLRILDLGTGSGCILGALLSELPAAWGWGVDRSTAACRVARANLADWGLAARSLVVNGDWSAALAPRTFDLVVSNPPYIESGAIPGLDAEVRLHDPREALDGGADGLDAYRAIADQAAGLLAPGGGVLLEIGQGQGDAVAALLAARTLVFLGRWRDLADIERVVGAYSSRR